MQETSEMWVRSLGWEDPLEEGMETHSSILAWRIPWTEEPGGLQPIESQRVRHDWSDLAHTPFIITYRCLLMNNVRSWSVEQRLTSWGPSFGRGSVCVVSSRVQMSSGWDAVGCMHWDMSWSIELHKTCSFVVSTGSGATLQVSELQTQEFYVNFAPSDLLYKRKEKESVSHLQSYKPYQVYSCPKRTSIRQSISGNRSSVYHFTRLLSGRSIHRLATSSLHFKPCSCPHPCISGAIV